MAKQKHWDWHEINLVLINGDKINLAIREDIYDDIWEGIELSLATEAVLCCLDWADIGLKVNYLGTELVYIDFKKIIGIEF